MSLNLSFQPTSHSSPGVTGGRIWFSFPGRAWERENRENETDTVLRFVLRDPSLSRSGMSSPTDVYQSESAAIYNRSFWLAYGAGWPRHRFGCLGDAGTRGLEE